MSQEKPKFFLAKRYTYLSLSPHRLRMNLRLPGQKGWGGGIDWDLGIDMYTLMYVKRITGLPWWSSG